MKFLVYVPEASDLDWAYRAVLLLIIFELITEGLAHLNG